MLLSQYHLVWIASNNFISISYRKFLFNLITSFKFNWCVLLLRKTISIQRNPLIVFLQDDVGAGIQSLQTYWNKTLPKPMERTIGKDASIWPRFEDLCCSKLQLVLCKILTLSAASIFVTEGLFICIYFLLFEENHQNRISRAGEKNFSNDFALFS